MLTFWVTTNALVVKAEQNSGYGSANQYVDLAYLAVHPGEFENQSVTTNGTVKYYGSIFMYEDFWLQAQNNAKIPVVTRFAKLSVPPVESLIEISGIIQHSDLEGGFYFLNASSWKALNASSVTTATPSPIPTPTDSPTPTPTPTPSPIQVPGQSFFFVESNSTVSEPFLNSTSAELSFTVSGPSATAGYVKVTIAKSLVSSVQNVKVYLDGSQLDVAITSDADSWLLSFTYVHSTHHVRISLVADAGEDAFLGIAYWTWIIVVIIIAMTGVLGFLFLRKKKKTGIGEKDR
jgi:hypothetical protein